MSNQWTSVERSRRGILSSQEQEAIEKLRAKDESGPKRQAPGPFVPMSVRVVAGIERERLRRAS
jgi:hypothetical protein